MKLMTLTIAICGASAVLAGTALAGGHPNDRAGLQGVGAASAIHETTVRPDDRAGLLGVGGAEANAAPSGRPDGRLVSDAADVDRTPPTVVLVESGGFDWSDAGIGAFGALGACLLAVSLAFGATWIRRGRGRQPAV